MMILEPIPSAFILERADVSLQELRWAFANGLIGAQCVVDISASKLTADLGSELLVKLAGIAHAELHDVSDLLTEVPLPPDASEEQRKWTWLLLSWAYERHRDDDHVTDLIGALYADLGYPVEMVPFGPYAPAYQGHRDPAEVRREIIREWRQYLERSEEAFGKHAAIRESPKRE